MARYFFVLIIGLFCASCNPSEEVAPSFNTSTSFEDLIRDQQLVDSINQNFYSIYSASFDRAKTLAAKAVALSKKHDLKPRLALALKNQGVIEYMTGNYKSALESALNSMEIYTQLKDTSGIARLSNEMGNFYRKVGQEDKALDMWDQAEEYAKISGDREALGTAYGMKGTFFWLKKDFELSDHYYLKCYQIRIEQSDSIGLGYALVDLADMEQRKRNLEKALSYFKASNQIRKRIGDYQGLVDNYKMIGDLYMNFDKPDEAIPYYQSCAVQCQNLGYPDLQRKSYDSLSHAYARLGAFKEAYELDQKADFLQDSLFSAEKTKAISELQIKYETAQKEQSLLEQEVLLSQQQAELTRKNWVLASAGTGAIFLMVLAFQLNQRQKLKYQNLLILREKETKAAQIEAVLNSQESERKRFARDLHDGFGQMISVLNLNLKSLEKENTDRESIFENSSKILDDMYKELKGICFNLMPETLIKKGVVDAIKEFAMRINHAGKIHVEVDTFGIDERLSDVQEISIYRITQEWINNIIKYSDASQITLSLTSDKSEITLLIEDNGSGFDKKLLTEGKGNGWKNLNSRTNLIKGEIELDTTPGIKGNTLILESPATLISSPKSEVPA